MKTIHAGPVLVLLLIMAACQRQTASPSNPVYNQEVIDAKGNTLLLGKSTRERLQQPPFDTWFNTNYNNYTTDSITAQQVKPLLKNKHLLLFMGTWCGDSRREVPRIYKLLDHCGITASQVQLVTLDYRDSAYKKSPGHEERGLSIIRVPTLLVYEGPKELGRIVETPRQSWEKDLLAILLSEP